MPKFNSNNGLQGLEFRSFVTEFRAESAALWFLCFYILVEYIRPQAMYSAINILPWGEFALLACVASVFITGSRTIGFGAMDKMFIAFSVLVVLSGVFAWSPEASLKDWTTYLSWILMYFCIVSILTTPNRILIFILFFILVNLKMSQFGARSFAVRGFGFAHWGLTGAPGWFHNSGELSLQMVVMFSISLSVLLAFRPYMNGTIRWKLLMFLFPGTAFLTVIGSSSRGGQLALGIILLVFLLRGSRLFTKILVIPILAYAVLTFLPAEQIARFEAMGEDKTSQLRLTHWEHAIDTIKHNPLGIGYRNWGLYYEMKYNPDKVEQVHNTVLEAFVDLGYPGGLLFLAMLITSFIMNARTKVEMNKIGGREGTSIAAIATGVSLGMLGTFIAALFMSVLYYPMFWLAFSLTSALRHISQKKIKEFNKLSSQSNGNTL